MDFNIFYISANRNECLLQALLRVAQKTQGLLSSHWNISHSTTAYFLDHPVHRHTADSGLTPGLGYRPTCILLNWTLDWGFLRDWEGCKMNTSKFLRNVLKGNYYVLVLWWRIGLGKDAWKKVTHLLSYSRAHRAAAANSNKSELWYVRQQCRNTSARLLLAM